MSPPIWLVTWNLQGAEGIDLQSVVERLRSLTDAEPDIVALQEVHLDQARSLATALGMERTWAFKHWPVVRGAEGMAVLARAGRPPTQRLDYVFLPPTWSCLELRTPSTTMSTFDGWDDWSVLSDHLPVAARLERRVGSAAQPA